MKKWWTSVVVENWWLWLGGFVVTTFVYGWHEIGWQEADANHAAREEAFNRMTARRGVVAEHDYSAKLQELQELQRAHAALSTAELFSLSDSDLYLEVTERLRHKRYAVGLGGMSEPERNITLINELEFEVADGGFDQFFSNSSGDCALQALAAARALDPKLGDIVARALAQFPNGKPDEDRAARMQQMGSMPAASEVWSKLGGEMSDDLSPLMARYIRAHKSQFR